MRRKSRSNIELDDRHLATHHEDYLQDEVSDSELGTQVISMAANSPPLLVSPWLVSPWFGAPLSKKCTGVVIAVGSTEIH